MSLAEESLTRIQKWVSGMIIALSIQFILGMVLNLFAVPPDDPKYATEPIFLKLIFPLHGILGIALLIGAIVLLFFALKSESRIWKKMATFGLISILIAAGGGIATIILKDNASEIASFVMSLGFILSFLSYGKFYFLLKTKKE